MQNEKSWERKWELSLRFDFYGPLIKENHRKIFEDYIQNDLSLGELSKEYGMTRQGIYDVVRRTSDKLDQFEEELKLIEKFSLAKEKLADIDQKMRYMEQKISDSSLSNEMERLLDQMKEIIEVM